MLARETVRPTALAFAGLALFGACTSKPDKAQVLHEWEEKQKAITPAVEARLNRIAALKLVDAAAATHYTGTVLTPAHSIVSQTDPAKEEVVGNAVLLYASDLPHLSDLTKAPIVRHRHIWSAAVGACASAIRQHALGEYAMYDGRTDRFELANVAYFPSMGVSGCQPLLAAKFVIVADQSYVQDEHRAPNAKTFQSGEFGGTLRVFDLDTGAYLGARRYSATSSAKIAVEVTINPDTHEATEVPTEDDAVSRDMQQRVQHAIDEALAAS